MVGGHVRGRRGVSRAVVPAVVACALVQSVSAFAEVPRPQDAVVLHDGTRLEGRVVEQVPGSHVVIDVDGRRRTFAWNMVGEIDVAKPSEPNDEGTSPSATFANWNAHRLVYELRSQLVGIVSAPRRYEPRGSCATGSGLAPVDTYGKYASARVLGSGLGLGARAAYTYAARPSTEARFPVWALRAGAGLDIDFAYVHMPTGLPEVSGELCSAFQRRTLEVARESTSTLLVQVPIQLGGQIGVGGFHAGPSWEGVIIGAAWAPSLAHLEPSAGERSTELRLFGTELTVDLVSLEDQPGPPLPRWRFFVFLSPPSRPHEALILKLGAGALWY